MFINHLPDSIEPGGGFHTITPLAGSHFLPASSQLHFRLLQVGSVGVSGTGAGGTGQVANQCLVRWGFKAFGFHADMIPLHALANFRQQGKPHCHTDRQNRGFSAALDVAL